MPAACGRERSTPTRPSWPSWTCCADGWPPGSRPSGTRAGAAARAGEGRRRRRLRPARSARALPLPRGSWPRPSAQRQLPPHRYLGGSLRAEPADPEVDAWLGDAEPFVYVSFGSFLSVRADVLRTVVSALRGAGVRAAIASGATPVSELGELPAGWLVREYLPQVRLLRTAAVLVTHGGNNSVTEAVGTATPMLVLPFSTDQFAGAAAVERVGVGEVLDPNRASVGEIRDGAPAAAGPHGRRRGAPRGRGRLPRSGPGAGQGVPRGRRLGDRPARLRRTHDVTGRRPPVVGR